MFQVFCRYKCWEILQAGEALQAKLVVVCGDAAASVARTVGPGQPWGRGRIAVIPKAADAQVACMQFYNEME